MQLSDLITEQDKQTIVAYIETYYGIQKANINIILKYWDKNKRTLYRALGNQLRVRIPVVLEKDDVVYHKELLEIYTPPKIEEIKKGKCNSKYAHIFVQSFVEFMYGHQEFVDNIYWWCVISTLFSYAVVSRGKITDFGIGADILQEKGLKIPPGMKIMKAMRKFLEFVGYKDWEAFECWRNDISDLNTKSKVQSTLVLSIHPLDMLTLSDNNCGWTSCYNLAQHGSYSKYIIGLLNSNNCLVAYLESSKEFLFEGNPIPNKSWRMLLVCHKDILLAGKPYPYENIQLRRKCLDILKDLVLKNLGWSYQYGPQIYHDLLPFEENWDIRDFEEYLPQSKKICVYTKAVYNDFVADKDTAYWCYRNYVSKTKKICICGQMHCLKCGELFFPKGWRSESTYKGFCDKCLSYKRCWHCELIKDNEECYRVPVVTDFESSYNEIRNICINCLCKDYALDPETGLFYRKNHLALCAELGMEVKHHLIHQLDEKTIKQNILE